MPYKDFIFLEDCCLFKAKELSGDAAMANVSAPCSVINHRGPGKRKKRKKQTGPSTHPCKLFFRKSCRLGFFTRKQLQFNIEDHRIHMELISVSFCSAYTKEIQFFKNSREIHRHWTNILAPVTLN